MSAWAKIRLAVARFGFWVWVVPGGYYTWSKFWRFVLERKYRKQKLQQFAHFDQLVMALGHMKWKEDPIKGLFDIISSPQKVENVFQLARLQDLPPMIGDCDEFAQYAADRIMDLRRRSQVQFVAYFMTINWFDKDGGFHGHNICALEKDDGEWGHIGNWFNGLPQWGFKGPQDIAEWFAYRNPRDGEGQLIAWALADADLRPYDSEVWNA